MATFVSAARSSSSLVLLLLSGHGVCFVFFCFWFLLAGPLFISDPASVLLLPRSLGGNFRLGCGVNCFTTVLLLLAPPTGKLFGARSHGLSFLETTEYRSQQSGASSPQTYGRQSESLSSRLYRLNFECIVRSSLILIQAYKLASTRSSCLTQFFSCFEVTLRTRTAKILTNSYVFNYFLQFLLNLHTQTSITQKFVFRFILQISLKCLIDFLVYS